MSEKTTSKNTTSAWSWKIDAEDLKKQIDGYDTLKITETYRGIAVLVVGSLLTLSLVLGYFGILTSLEDVLFSLVLYIPALFFVYKGHKWAIITLLILWTIEKVGTLIYSLQAGYSPISSIIWFLIVAPIIYKAYVVERERTKVYEFAIFNSVDAVNSSVTFCAQCGGSISQGVNFCKQCGIKVLS